MSDPNQAPGLLIWYTDKRLGDAYVPITFDDLTLHVHEMAAVAWDRDSPEILDGREVGENLRILGAVDPVATGPARIRFSMHTTYGYGTTLAIWDENNVRWRGSRKMQDYEVGDLLGQKAGPSTWAKDCANPTYIKPNSE